VPGCSDTTLSLLGRLCCSSALMNHTPTEN
jgi:hypothetical protein